MGPKAKLVSTVRVRPLQLRSIHKKKIYTQPIYCTVYTATALADTKVPARMPCQLARSLANWLHAQPIVSHHSHILLGHCKRCTAYGTHLCGNIHRQAHPLTTRCCHWQQLALPKLQPSSLAPTLQHPQACNFDSQTAFR
jgi:hypothetical protein